MLKNYFANLPDIDYPNFAYLFNDVTERFPEREALRYRTGKTREFSVWTYRKMREEVYALSRFFVSKGLVKGDRIGIYSENRPEWCVLYLAIVVAGYIAVPIDALLEPEDVEGIIRTSEIKMLCYSKKHEEIVQRLIPQLPGVSYLAIDEPDANGNSSIESYQSVVSRHIDAELPKPESIAKDDAASIIFTSGTTGLAKGVTLTHHGIIANINASIQSLPIDEHDVFMCVLPLHHTYPTTCSFLSPISVGASITICEKLVGKVILDDVRDSGGTIIIAVPLLYDKVKEGLEANFKSQPFPVRTLISVLMGLSRFFRKLHIPFGKVALKSIREKAGLATIRLLVAGGVPLNYKTVQFFDDLGFYIVQGYGMSENGPLITTNTMKYKNNKSAGLVVKNTEIRIDDPNEEGIGEIVVRSPSLMKGYFGNPEATKQAFTEDGFLKTGDLGRFDKKGYLYITGRIKSLIVTRGGKNIYPEEIEQKFEGSRKIQEILVLGRKGKGGEDIVAICYPNYDALKEDNPGVEITKDFAYEKVKEEILKVNRTLPAYKKISDFIVRDEEFEKTSSKKIKRYLYTEFK